MVGASVLPINASGGLPVAMPDGASLFLDFTNGHAVQQDVVTSFETLLNCNRAGPGTVPMEAGTVRHFGANELRRSKRGLLIEETRTNFLLNSFAPVTQTLALGAGDYALSVIGTGSATLSGDAAGVASEGATVAFTLVGGGSVTVSVSGPLAAFQLENGSFLTSPIETAGAPVTRPLDNISFVDVSWLDPQQCTLLVEWEQVAPATGVQTLVRWQQMVSHRLRSGNAAQVQVKDAMGTLILNQGSSPVPPPLGVHRLAAALAIDDMAVAWSASITGVAGFSTDGSGTSEGGAGAILLGSAGGGEVLNGWLRKLVYWPERMSDGDVSNIAL